MTTREYLASLKNLGLTPASNETAERLGVSKRQAQRYAAGAPIPVPIAKLLRALRELDLHEVTRR